MLEEVRRDSESIEHDEKVRRGDLREDTHFRQEWLPCPDPSACKFDSTGHCWCGKRRGPGKVTRNLQMLEMAMAGGMPVQRDELGYAEWAALGLLRKREQIGRLF